MSIGVKHHGTKDLKFEKRWLKQEIESLRAKARAYEMDLLLIKKELRRRKK